MTMKKPVTRSEWMQQQLQKDGIFLTRDEVKDILSGNYEPYEPLAADMVLELDKEWGED